MYKIQLVHLEGSIFVELCGENSRAVAEEEAENLFQDNKKSGVSVLWVGLWESNEVIDVYDGEKWGREYREF